jgi:hypothetical protein
MISKPNLSDRTRKRLTIFSHGSHKVGADALAMGSKGPSHAE